MSALVFLDTETTGLADDDEVWEFAAIRREPSGAESTMHLFIEHDETKCAKLPARFLDDHMARFPTHSHDLADMRAAGVVTKPRAAVTVGTLFLDRAHMVGANPAFDAGKLDPLLTAYSVPHRWHYHLVDVEALMLGFLAGICQMGGAAIDGSCSWLTGPHRPPYQSNDLSRAIGINPDDYGRHQAMDDTRWARDIYDRVMGGAPERREGLPL